MSEPRCKRLKTSLPICKNHKALSGSRVTQNLPAVVEESLCGVTTLLMEAAYRLQALARIFEQHDVALPRVAGFFHQESEKEQKQAEAMLAYLTERGAHYCNKDIKKPGCEDVCSLIPALEVMLAQWKELLSCMVELCQLAGEHGDPHTASTVKGCFLAPLVPKVKELGDLLTNAKRAGCADHEPGFGEYLTDQLLEEWSGI
ncbi:ferritin light chain, oocyte isoform-like [Brienomyrus brachyistius]|uniref:ferritin light chain, oocyte isoform-like n=1 Tax=Brienomyrus brachyistius TaxID=42636 RepID=UPI0020B1FE0C|nr:ferritin light chain, oocyte isoform-like [Brienomyrus brachyistius]XP_048829093.1 ferritin light chain, oocyte isoform-like [Brienomyrus brachyistius]